MGISDNSYNEDAKSTVFLLTKPPNSERAKLCIQLANRSRNAVLYLAGDGVFNLLDPFVEALPPGSIYACKEDMDARGVLSEDPAISLAEFYEKLVEDIVVRSDRVYAF